MALGNWPVALPASSISRLFRRRRVEPARLFLPGVGDLQCGFVPLCLGQGPCFFLSPFGPPCRPCLVPVKGPRAKSQVGMRLFFSLHGSWFLPEVRDFLVSGAPPRRSFGEHVAFKNLLLRGHALERRAAALASRLKGSFRGSGASVCWRCQVSTRCDDRPRGLVTGALKAPSYTPVAELDCEARA